MLFRLIRMIRYGRRRRWRMLPILLMLPAMLSAQSTIVLGNATSALTGAWKFHTGDNPGWALPDFDDSAWSSVDLTPPPGSYDPYIGSSGFVPGWTAQGYPAYSGYAWYRLRLTLHDPVPGGLAIKMPDDVDDAYQVFANGRLIGELGRFSANGVSNYIAQPRAFLLPPGNGDGPLTLSIRMWMDPHTLLVETAAGGLHGPPVLGQAPVIMAMNHVDWDTVDHSLSSGFFEGAILLLAIVVAFSLYALDRSEPAYLLLGVNCVVILLQICLGEVVYFTTLIPAMPAVFLRDVMMVPLEMALWIFFWASWFQFRERADFRRAVWAIVALQAFLTALERAPLYGRLLPVGGMVWTSPILLALKLLLGALVLLVTYRGILKNRAEGLLALPAVILIGVAQFQNELELFHARLVIFLHGYSITASQIATAISLTIITVLLLRRFFQSQRAREQWKAEMEQARQVQQMLIPEELPAIPGFALESEYRPAQQVGGDFFQILPGDDGSVLAVLGDVSGKGLKAAMLVAMIVGTIRTLAKITRDPAEILQGINNMLYGRMSSQFATCLAVHITATGDAAIANAGHLPPYWNGVEAEIAGSIPLGIIDSPAIEQSRLLLHAGDRLILLTDGVVEAQDKSSQLFGFDRTRELASQDRSAVEIVLAAQTFGQEDDITVLRIQRSS